MEHRLELAPLTHQLHSDGRLSDEDLARVAQNAHVKVHPLIYLAEQRIADRARPGHVLDMDAVLAWLSERSNTVWIR